MMRNYRERNIDTLFKKLYEFKGITLEMIRSNSRKRDLVIPRAIVGYILHIHIGITLQKSGEIINRDHSSISFYKRKHTTNMLYAPYEELYLDLYSELEEHLFSGRVSYLEEKISMFKEDVRILKRKKKELIKEINSEWA
jgi:hypothetical protein